MIVPESLSTREAEERARRMAVEDLQQNLFVEAGAGTGKTTILVDRIINLVGRGKAKLTEVVAITFTEMAAGELLFRVRNGLENALKMEGLEADTRARFEDAIRDLERAPISTVHGLAGQILRDRPVEAGIDPHFTPLDEVSARFAVEEAWEEWLPGALERDPAPARRALRAGIGLKKIRELAEFLLEHRDRVEGQPARPNTPPDLQAFMKEWERIQAMLGDLSGSCVDEEDRSFQQIGPLREQLLLAQGFQQDHDEERLEGLIQKINIKHRAGNKKNWKPKDDCTEVKKLMEELSRRTGEVRAGLDHDLLENLALWLRGFIVEIVDRFRRRGVLTFQDHLVECRDLLRGNLEVRGHFQNQFRYLLIDEFQDTDPLQVEVAFFLAEKKPAARDWREVKLERGKLFIVGDPKQSIYRFRRADIELYQEVKEKVSASGEVLTIGRNFRSVPGVIDWINETFGALIHPPPDGAYQPRYEPLLHHRGELADAVLDLKTEDTSGDTTASEARREEARVLARFLVNLVRDKSDFHWRDVGILFPKSSGMEVYEDALRLSEIPYHLEGGREFVRREEVAGILNCLEALDQPEDGIALVGSLKSSAFGHTDAEFLEIIAAGGTLTYLVDPPLALAGSPLAENLALLRELHRERNRLPMAALVSRLVDGTQAAAAAALRQRGGLPASQNLKKLVALARRFDADRTMGKTLARFTHWLRRMRADENAREEESPVFEESDDVVRILSIHKAKGLQFPVVVLVNLGIEDRFQDPFFWDGTRLQMKLTNSTNFSMTTRGFEEAVEREKRRQEAERIRLLYVASTRARDRLVISRIVSQPRGTEKGDLRHLENHPAPKPWKPVGAARGKESAAPDPALVEHIAESYQEVKERPGRIQEDHHPPFYLRPSGEDRSTGKDRASRQWDPVARQMTLAFGTAVHRLLEVVDPNASKDHIATLGSLCASEAGIANRAGEVTAHAERALGTRVFCLARRSGRLFREVPFFVKLDEQLISGKIDLVLEIEGSYVIADYKTDRLESILEISEKAAQHEEQLRLYARALEKVTGQPVSEAVLIFTALGAEQGVELKARRRKAGKIKK